jgi:hypothetical protein
MCTEPSDHDGTHYDAVTMTGWTRLSGRRPADRLPSTRECGYCGLTFASVSADLCTFCAANPPECGVSPRHHAYCDCAAGRCD